MKITINNLYDLEKGLLAIGDYTFPMKTALIIQRNILAIKTEMKVIEELKNKIVNKYIDEDKTQLLIKQEGQTNSIAILEGKVDEFQKAYMELMNEEVSIEVQKIYLSIFEGLTIKPNTLCNITPILENEGVK